MRPKIVQPIDPRVIAAAESLASPSPSDAGLPVVIEISNEAEAPRYVNGDRSQSYALTIAPEQVLIQSATSVGCYYAIQTLLQISANEPHPWPCRRIEDAPDLELRGFSLDVTRGKVPALATLRSLIDRLASLKMNHLQLYVEHTFDFSFDPDIARDCSPLTHDDIRALDAYCRERFIELTPSLACFGHMGRILSLPQYRQLAEVPCEIRWEDQSWPQRLRGLTLDARNPEGRNLIRRMLDEYLPLFASCRVNIGGDETHDLGRGRNASFCQEHGKAQLYTDHITFLADECARHDKRLMLWADVIRSFPNRIDDLPSNVTLLDWGYEADSQFPAVASAHRGDRNVIVCPGTSGWNRVLNGLDNADRNIANATRAANEHDATGMLLTDWGDHGHFNMLACSTPALITAAARGWHNDAVEVQTLDDAIARSVFGGDRNELMTKIRSAARLGDDVHTWIALYEDADASDVIRRIDTSAAKQCAHSAHEALQALESCGDEPELNEWRLALRATQLLAEKVAQRIDGRSVQGRRLNDLLSAWSGFVMDYECVWQARNRSNRLQDVLDALRAGHASATKHA